MKALVYHGPMDVEVDDKPKPSIKDPEDIILKITSTAICGSDLHLFHGNVKTMEPGQTLGHEFTEIVDQVGDRVTEVKQGDRVVIPFNICCGRCWFCQHHAWTQCERSNPKGESGGVFGYTQMLGGYDGGQAEYVRVPFANVGPLKIPDEMNDKAGLLVSPFCTFFSTLSSFAFFFICTMLRENLNDFHQEWNQGPPDGIHFTVKS